MSKVVVRLHKGIKNVGSPTLQHDFFAPPHQKSVAISHRFAIFVEQKLTIK